MRFTVLRTLCSAVAMVGLVAGCGGGDGDGEVVAPRCFDAAIYAGGASTLIQYDVSGAQSGLRNVSTEVMTNATFNGITGLIRRNTSSSNPNSGPPILVSGTTDYLSATAPNVYTLFGSESRGGQFAFPITTTNIYSPSYIDRRAALQVAETDASRLVGTKTVVDTLAQSTTTTSFDLPISVTFVARETVQVPAGTYATCRYAVTGGGEPSRTQWIYRGLVVQQESGSGGSAERLRMISGTLNGAPL